jgi:hypothetical protein
MKTTDEDTIDDFKGVFDFRSLEESYRIVCKA